MELLFVVVYSDI